MNRKRTLKRDLNNTYFVPMKRMRDVMKLLSYDLKNDLTKEKHELCMKKKSCDNNLYLIQRTRLNTFHYSTYGKQNWMVMFFLGCRKALYSHDWDKLLYLLRKVPKWKFTMSEYMMGFDCIYIRYLVLLLMFHPSSQAQGLLCEYLHMSLGCRSDTDKKAILKILLDLPKKLPQPTKIFNEDSD